MEGQRILRIGICDMWWDVGPWEVSWFHLCFSSAIYCAEWRECFARDEMPFELSTRLLLRALQSIVILRYLNSLRGIHRRFYHEIWLEHLRPRRPFWHLRSMRRHLQLTSLRTWPMVPC